MRRAIAQSQLAIDRITLQGEHTMKPLKWLAVVALSGALAACASDIQRVRSAEGTGSPFTRGLTTEYKDFSTFEADEMNDWSNARHFARKSLLASQGEAVQPETYVVYFDWNKFNIKPDGAQILDKAIAAAKAGGTPSISVTGFADRSGPEDYNLKLSLKRADAVREYLIKHGVAAEQITVSGKGEAEPAVPTADGVKEPRNRRVEIIVQ